LFYSEAPASWKERMPRVADTENGRAWIHNGKIIRYVGDVGLGRGNFRFDHATMSVRLRRKARTAFTPMPRTACSGRRRRSIASKIKSATASALK
jgi:hypothetical protein